MDSDIFDSLYEAYWAAIYNSTYKRLPDPNKALEVTQEAFFQLWLNKDKYARTEKAVVLFLLTTVRNEIFKLMEKECIEIVYPPSMLFENVFPFAN